VRLAVELYIVAFASYLLVLMNDDGVVKTLHPESHRLAYLVRCYNFSIITTYRMYAEIREKLHASNMKLFTYPSEMRFLRVCQ